MELILFFLGLCFLVGVGIAIGRIGFTLTLVGYNFIINALGWIWRKVRKIKEFFIFLKFKLFELPKLRKQTRGDKHPESNEAIAKRLLFTKHPRTQWGNA